MRLPLDTHVFIWWADDPEKLSPAALAALEDEANELLLSVASVWEMQIKIQLGKLKLSLPLKELEPTRDQRPHGFACGIASYSGTGWIALSSQRPVRSFADCPKY